MLRSQFEEDLEKLHNQFYAKGQEVLSQINRTVRAFVTHDRDLAKEVIEEDAEVNGYEVKLEKKSFEMIALQQPVSQDLRTVLTVLKAVSDLERMGDHAVSIAKATIRMKGEQRIPAVEEEIKKMTQIAEEANEVKSHFLSNMSYDIRSTLNNVLGFSQLMTQDPNSIETAQWKEYSEIVQTNSTELIQLVNDILDLSRLEAGKTKWQVQEYDIIPLCSDIVSIAQMRNKGKIQIDFKTTIKEQASQLDITRFTQVIVSTLIYPVPCDLQRHVTFSLYCNEQEKLLVFRIINTPLADAEFQIRKTDVRHRINRLTIEYFGGTYTVISNLKEEPTIIITYPYSKSAAEDAVRDNFHRQIRL